MENGIQVGVANGVSMKQIETGKIPFNNIPTGAINVAVFKNMSHPLLGCRRLVEQGCYIILDT